MDGTKIGTMKVRDAEYEVRVTAGGTFFADLAGYPVDSPTYDGLAAKLETATRKQAVKIELRMCNIESHGGIASGNLTSPQKVTRGTITGIHGSNGNLLITWADGRKEQLGRWATLLPDLPTEHERELNALLEASWKARRKLDGYLARLPKLDARREAERMVREAEQA